MFLITVKKIKWYVITYIFYVNSTQITCKWVGEAFTSQYIQNHFQKYLKKNKLISFFELTETLIT